MTSTEWQRKNPVRRRITRAIYDERTREQRNARRRAAYRRRTVLVIHAAAPVRFAESSEYATELEMMYA